MNSPSIYETVRQLMFAEARALDRQQWDEWLQMLSPQVRYWVPAWKQGLEPTGNPDTEVSLIYHDNRRGLEDRIKRLRSGRSPASIPLRRTARVVSNIIVNESSTERIQADAVFHVQVYEPRARQTDTFYGFYQYQYIKCDDDPEWLVAGKKIVLLNDQVKGMLDFYML